MRLAQLAGPVLFIAGVAALAVGLLEGEATLSLFIIFPVVTATGAWSLLGIVLMISGVFVFFWTWSIPTETVPAPPPSAPPVPSAAAPPPVAARRRWGGVVFLGPIPVVFGSDQKVTQWMLLVGVLLFVALVVLTIIALRGI